MSYYLDWQVPNRALLLSLRGMVTAHEARQINEEVMTLLDETPVRLLLLLDAEEMTASLPFDQIRRIFTFMMHPALRGIFVVAPSKLSRLLLTVIFVATTAHFRLFETMPQALQFLDVQLARYDV